MLIEGKDLDWKIHEGQKVRFTDIICSERQWSNEWKNDLSSNNFNSGIFSPSSELPHKIFKSHKQLNNLWSFKYEQIYKRRNKFNIIWKIEYLIGLKNRV